MFLTKVGLHLGTVIRSTARISIILACAATTLIMLITISDIVMRLVVKRALIGSVEIIEYLMVAVVFLAFAWCAVQGKHVKVDLVVERFSTRVQKIFDMVTGVLSLGLCVLISWQSVLESLVLMKSERVSELLSIPTYPFVMIMALGFAIFSLAIIAQLAGMIAGMVKR